MRCKSCNYPLWNLPARLCPECGAAFAPSEFEFVPHSVAYCCPHCDQPYYGTGERGHLEPVEFDCVTCGNHVGMDEMVLRPTEGLQEQQTRTGDMPWLDRKNRGRVKAWFATVWLGMMHPATLMRGVPDSTTIGEALRFAVLTHFIFMVVRLLPLLCFVPFLFAGASNAGNTGVGPGGALALLGGGTAIGLVAPLIVVLLCLGIWGLTGHAVLALTGSRAGGMGRTYEAICYSSGANAITVVPCIGDFSGIWWIISAIIMLREGQRVSGVRATFALLAMPIILLLLVVGLWATLVGAAIAAPSMNPINTATRTAEIATLGQRVSVFSAARDGAPPGHALELVPEHRSGTGLFISADTATGPDDVPVNDGTLRDFQRLGQNRQRAAALQAAAALPPNVVAHRVGDYVFTWHGMDLDTADPALWLAVASPDPDVNPVSDPGPPIVVLLVGGGTLSIMPEDLEESLRSQNRIRAAGGLDALPDPSTVTHRKPATGGG